MEIQTANAIELTRTSLKTLLGLDAHQPFKLADGAGEFQLPETYPGYENLLKQALAQRPEIMAAQKEVEIADRPSQCLRQLRLRQQEPRFLHQS